MLTFWKEFVAFLVNYWFYSSSLSIFLDEKIVEAHGSFANVYCMDCRHSEDVKEFWKQVADDNIPRCSQCKGVVRPAVTFFGEGLPSLFADLRMKDFPQCDLLIVMGTSLVVYPFASLVGDVTEDCPRLLINKDATGVFR